MVQAALLLNSHSYKLGWNWVLTMIWCYTSIKHKWAMPCKNVPSEPMLTVKAKTSLCIHAVWAGPSLFPYRFIGHCLFVLRFYGPVNPMGSCRARSIYLTTRLLGRLSPLSTSIVQILSPETDNCPSWISGRERITVENISWTIPTKECCRPLGHCRLHWCILLHKKQCCMLLTAVH